MKIQVHYGRGQTGKDIQKIMVTSGAIFASFAAILKRHKKDGCKFTDADVDAFYMQYSFVFVL